VSFDGVVLPLLVLLLAGFVKGVIGLGLPAVGVGLLGLVMVPAQAAALLVVPATVTNVWQLWAGPDFRGLLRRLWPMLVGIMVGGWLGAGALAGENTGRTRVWLGLVLAGYAIFGLVAGRPRLPRRLEIWLGPLAGIATGIVTTATGLSMLPLVPYLNALGLERDDMVQALGLSFTVSTLSLAVDLTGSGVFDHSLMLGSAVAVIPAVFGMQIGQYVRNRISPVLFRRCFFSGMLLLGLELARH
jgi:uncharacterized membrane protein YfcA